MKIGFNVVWRAHLQRLRERKFNGTKLQKGNPSTANDMRPKSGKTNETPLFRVRRAKVSDP